MRYLKVLLPVLALSLVFASCAAKLPQAEVDAANAAFAEAKTAQADVLAADSFSAANAANEALQANLSAKDYGKTKALAKALVDASAKAKADAVAGLEAAKADVAQLGTDISAEIPAVQKIYAKALRSNAAKKAATAAKVDLKAIKAGLAAAPKSLSDAQALTDVVSSKTQLAALKAKLDGFKSAIEAVGIKE
jgi:hypothetical protein